MTDRFPLIVNPVSKKIEELVSGDNLELTGNGIIINGNIGLSGQYLKSNGSTVEWGNPGDVYLTQPQILSSKTFEDCVLSGSLNAITNISNNSLVNSGITINGSTIALGGSTTTPDNNTTYTISTIDGATAAKKVIRLISGGNFGAGINDDVIISVASPSTIPSGQKAVNLSISRSNDEIILSATSEDADTITSLQSATGGTPQTGTISIAATGASTVSQDIASRTITINTVDNDTITRLRAGTGQTLNPGNFTFLAGTAVALTQGVDANTDPTITISSSDTITSIKGGGTGTAVGGEIVTFQGGTSGNVTVSQTGNTVFIDSTDTNTITRVASGPSNTLTAGDFRFVASGATTISQSSAGGLTTIVISSVNTDTGAALSASEGILLSNGTEFSLKNATNLNDNRILKWDNSASQLVNSIITDNGSTVTIAGDLNVTGTNTIINTTTLSVADNIIELRRGNSLSGTDSGIQVNRTTNSGGTVTAYSQLQWFEAGGYWRSYDGSISRRFVTEDEVQTLTNKTLTSPILTSPTLGTATATTLNGLTISTTANSTFTISNLKTVTFNNTTTFNSTDGSTINFGNGGSAGAQVIYSSNTLASFATTTSTQLRGVVSDSTGTGNLVFASSPQFVTSITTNSSTFSVFNTSATTINAFGAATAVNIGASTGTTTVNNSLSVSKNATFNTIVGDTFTVNGTPNFENSDVIIRGGSAAPLKIGRGGGQIPTNTRIGYNALENNTTGSQSVAVGYEACALNTEGFNNVAIGYQALRTSLGGDDNIAIGKTSQLTCQTGNGNVAIGTSSLESNIIGNYNVCIGHFAGYALAGSGNVLIGAASDQNSTNATYAPPSASGNNQLVIGSGTEAWIRGNNSFNVTIPNNLNVGGELIISGNLTVNGTTTTINSRVISVDDKTFELGAVTTITFTSSVQNNSNIITGVTPTSGLIAGMELTSLTAGINIPTGTTIVSIASNTATLSNVVNGSTGSATFEAIGPSDLSADGGGLVLKGTTDKSITWSDTTDAWTSTEHFDIPLSKEYRVGNILVAKNSQLGPSAGSWSLGAGVTFSSLTSVGTLSSLSVTGNTVLTGKLTTNTPTTLSTTLDVGISFTNTSTKTYPTTSGFSITAGLAQNIELGTSQTIDTVTPGGFNNVRGIQNTLTKSAGNTQDIERLSFTGFAQNFNWTDANTCKQYVGISDTFSYGGINANGRTSSSFNAQSIFLVPPDGGTQTITYVSATNSLTTYNAFAGTGTSTVNITNGYGVLPNFNSRASTSGTNTTTIGSYTFLGTSPFWGTTASGSAINNTTITNLYGLRLTPPISSTGLTITNNWGIYQEWGDANNYFAGNIQMASGKGIDFSATANAAGMTSELLDDYEEGTWTPTLNFSGNSVGLTYSRQVGKYVKVGNIVYCSGHFQVSNKGSSTGTAVVSGLPFTYAAVTGGWFFPMGVRGNLNVGGAESVSFYISSSASSSMTLYSCNTSGGSNSGVPDTAFNNSTEIDINVWFYVS
jgi:hypothetical protein